MDIRTRYLNDPLVRSLVDYLESMIHQLQFTPTEIRECAMLAAINYEMHRPPQAAFIPEGSLDGLDVQALKKERALLLAETLRQEYTPDPHPKCMYFDKLKCPDFVASENRSENCVWNDGNKCLSEVELSEAEVHILEHSLGLTSGTEMYRNRFVTSPACTDYNDCESLVKKGFMVKGKNSLNEVSESYLYAVTDGGKAAVLKKRGKNEQSKK